MLSPLSSLTPCRLFDRFEDFLFNDETKGKRRTAVDSSSVTFDRRLVGHDASLCCHRLRDDTRFEDDILLHPANNSQLGKSGDIELRI